MNGYRVAISDGNGRVYGVEYLTQNPDDDFFTEIDSWVAEIIDDYSELYGFVTVDVKGWTY